LQKFLKDSRGGGDYDRNKSSHHSHGNKASRIVILSMKNPYVLISLKPPMLMLE